MERAEIRDLNGAPTLFVDGQPRSSLAFYGGLAEGEGPERRPSAHVRGMGQAGVHVYNPPVPSLQHIWTGPQAWDCTAVDADLEVGLAADPEALYLPRIEVDAPDWWKEAHPEAVGRGWRQERGGLFDEKWLQSFSSAAWLAEAGQVLQAYVRHLEAGPFGSRIIGYHICAGATGEWSYGWWGPSVHEYSQAQERGFRAWLRQRYQGDPGRLRAAWKDAAVTFDTAAIPSGERRTRGDWFEFFDPALGRAVPDYLEYHNRVVADAILHFARLVKDETQRRKLFAVFYGYYFFNTGPLMLDVGHRALARVLDSPDVDILICPSSYRERQIGGVALAQVGLGSVRLHHKLFYAEDDTRTFLAPESSEYGRAETLRDTLEILKRNYACYATQGASLWWMEQTPGWFSHPDILGLVSRLRVLDEQLLAQERRCAAEIAVVVSDQSTYYLRFSESLVEPLINAQMVEHMTRIGAPFDTYLADDLPEMPEYRLYIFLACSYLSPEQRRAVQERVLGRGHTVLWVYACGYVTEHGLSAEAMSRLVGIRLVDEELGGRPRLAITDYEHPITRDLSRATQIETHQPIGPLFSAVDPEAHMLGDLHASPGLNPQWQPCRGVFANRWGLAAREMADGPAGGSWRSVWCGVPNLPSPLLRGIAQWAGVHIYSTGDDPVYANDRLLGVHARYAGQRSLRLPRRCTVVEALTGRVVAQDTAHLEVRLERGQTGLWLLT